MWPGCTRYHLKVYYRYSYALGLRIPVVEVPSRDVREDIEGTHTGKLGVVLRPFEGDAGDYRDAGMPQEYVLGGREALAEFCMPDGCGAGYDVKLPLINDDDFWGIEGMNLLKVPARWGRPIRNGEINPPDVGENNPLGSTKIDLDLLWGNLNFGAYGAEVFPVLRLDMRGLSKQIHANFEEANCSGDRQMTFRPRALAVHQQDFIMHHDRRTAYLFKPSYTFDLKLRVGVEPSLFVDFGVWDHRWNIARLWFPWGINSPDITLDHHQGTNCGLRFQVTTERN